MIKRSDRAHAKIKRLDITKAAALPGVAAIVTADDVVDNVLGMFVKDQQHFVTDTVRQFSDVIAAVAAETREIAEQACQLIEIDYEDLPVISSIEEAMAEDAYKIHGGDSNVVYHRPIVNGDVEEGFSKSDLIVEQHLSTPGVEHACIEPRAGIVYIDEISGDLVIHATMQKPFDTTADTAKAIGWPLNKVRGIVAAIGGAFGGKNEVAHEPAMALLALKTGRPVKHEFTREDEFNASSVRHAYKMHYRTGLTKEGKIMAREVNIVSDTGPYVTWGVSTLSKAAIHACGAYDIPHMKIDGKLVYTNNPIGGAMRGFGVTQMGFAYEAHTDYCARQLGMDPVEFRRINMMHDGSKLPTEMKIQTVTVEACLDKAIDLAKERGDW